MNSISLVSRLRGVEFVIIYCTISCFSLKNTPYSYLNAQDLAHCRCSIHVDWINAWIHHVPKKCLGETDGKMSLILLSSLYPLSAMWFCSSSREKLESIFPTPLNVGWPGICLGQSRAGAVMVPLPILGLKRPCGSLSSHLGYCHRLVEESSAVPSEAIWTSLLLADVPQWAHQDQQSLPLTLHWPQRHEPPSPKEPPRWPMVWWAKNKCCVLSHWVLGWFVTSWYTSWLCWNCPFLAPLLV